MSQEWNFARVPAIIGSHLPETSAGLHFVVFSDLTLVHFATLTKSA